MAKKQIVAFRFSDGMKKHLQELAQKNGLTVAEYVRQLIAREMLK
jgi:predicted DNA-binding protein